MKKIALAVFLTLVASLISSRLAIAGSSLPPACLAPMAQDEPDPDVRNISLNVTSNKQYVEAQVCVVSGLDRLAGLGVTFGLFDVDGNFVAINGQALGALDPVNAPDPNHPKLISLSATDVPIDARNALNINNIVLVTVTWTVCQNFSGACVPGNTKSTPFLRKATSTLKADQ